LTTSSSLYRDSFFSVPGNRFDPLLGRGLFSSHLNRDVSHRKRHPAFPFCRDSHPPFSSRPSLPTLPRASSKSRSPFIGGTFFLRPLFLRLVSPHPLTRKLSFCARTRIVLLPHWASFFSIGDTRTSPRRSFPVAKPFFP